MILLPSRSLLAIAAVVDVARHARPTPVVAKALAARNGLKPRHLESVLQALVRTGILKGVRGPRGGYELARDRRRISIGDVVRAIEPSIAAATARPGLVADVIEPAIRPAGEVFLAALDRVTVEDLCRAAGPEIAEGSHPDFTI